MLWHVNRVVAPFVAVTVHVVMLKTGALLTFIVTAALDVSLPLFTSATKVYVDLVDLVKASATVMTLFAIVNLLSPLSAPQIHIDIISFIDIFNIILN